MPKKKSFAQLNASRKPRTLTRWVTLDVDGLTRIAELEREIKQATEDDETLHRAPLAPALREERDALLRGIEANAVKFTFQALTRKAWRDLIAQHPHPEKPDTLRWNADTFIPAAITACCIEPEGVDGAVICEEWDEATARLLGDMAVSVNEQRTDIPFFARSTNETPGSPPSSTTPPPEA